MRYTLFEKWPFGDLQRNHYRVIYMDPAWLMKMGTKNRPQHYKRMSEEDMRALPVRDLCHPEGCAIYIWTTDPMLMKSMLLATQAWGFKFSCRVHVWIKTHRSLSKGNQSPLFLRPDKFHMNMGFTSRKNPEDVLLFKHKRMPPRNNRNVRCEIFAPPREHSRKPDEIYTRIENLYPGPYCELFARNRRPGWDSWGDEVEKFPAVEAA